MTDQAENKILLQLNRAFKNLAHFATQSATLPTYLLKCAQALQTEVTTIQAFALIPTKHMASPQLYSDPLQLKVESNFFGVIPFQDGDESVMVEFALADTQSWDGLQLWQATVQQVWESHHVLDDDELAIQTQIDLYRQVNRISHQINEELVSGEIMNDACRRIVDTLPYIDHVGIVINDNAPISGTVVAEFPDTGSIGVQLQLEGYPIHDKLESTHEPIPINDLGEAEDLLADNWETLKAVGIQSLLIVPLLIEQRLIGSIGLDCIQAQHTFTQNELEILSGLAAQISTGIHNTELFEEISARIVSEAITTQVSERLPLRSDLDALIRSAANEIGVIVGAKQVKIHLNPTYLEQSEFQE